MSVISLFFGSVTIYGWILLGCLYVSGLILIHINEQVTSELQDMRGVLGILFAAAIVILWPISFIAVLVLGFAGEVFSSLRHTLEKILGRFRKLTGD